MASTRYGEHFAEEINPLHRCALPLKLVAARVARCASPAYRLLVGDDTPPSPSIH